MLTSNIYIVIVFLLVLLVVSALLKKYKNSILPSIKSLGAHDEYLVHKQHVDDDTCILKISSRKDSYTVLVSKGNFLLLNSVKKHGW